MALLHMLSPGRFPTRRAGALALIAAFFNDLGHGQVFDFSKDGIGLSLPGPGLPRDWLAAE
jgi:hypothetical protein